MINFAYWRRLAVVATIDAILIVSAGTVLAAPATQVDVVTPHVPTLLMLGVGMVWVGHMRRRRG